MVLMRRIVLYTAGLVVPPVMLGIILTFSSVSDLMILKQPDPVQMPAPDVIAKNSSRKPKALILISNSGVQITDLLGVHELLSESGVFEVVTAAPERVLTPLTGGVAILPDLTLSEAPRADLLVIPAQMNPEDTAIQEWLKAHADQSKTILAVCEGARVVAKAGLLQGKKATSHFIALKSLRESDPQTEWVQGPRYVEDGKIITSAGVTGSLDAALFAIEKFSDRRTAEWTADRLGVHWNRGIQKSADLVAGDMFELFMRGAYDWRKKYFDVLVYPGVSELSLAALLDTFPRALNYRLQTVASERVWIKTRNGLTLVPSAVLDNGFHPDFLLIPSSTANRKTQNPASAQALEKAQAWTSSQNIPVKSYFYDKPGVTWDHSFDLLYHLEGKSSNRIIALISKLTEYPYHTARSQRYEVPSASRFPMWIGPVLVGLFGLFLAWLFDRRFSAAVAHTAPPKTKAAKSPNSQKSSNSKKTKKRASQEPDQEASPQA